MLLGFILSFVALIGIGLIVLFNKAVGSNSGPAYTSRNRELEHMEQIMFYDTFIKR